MQIIEFKQNKLLTFLYNSNISIIKLPLSYKLTELNGTTEIDNLHRLINMMILHQIFTIKYIFKNDKQIIDILDKFINNDINKIDEEYKTDILELLESGIILGNLLMKFNILDMKIDIKTNKFKQIINNILENFDNLILQLLD